MKTPRDYQEEAIGSVFNYFDAHTGNPIIALPTAAGKALVIAEIVRRALAAYPYTRLVMATHSKELVQQNADELRGQWPRAPLGIACDGLGSKNFVAPVVFGSILTMKAKAELLGKRDLLIVDECHAIGDDDKASYNTLIAGLKKLNPALKVIGLSATIYRLRMGLLTNGTVFTDVCYNLTDMAGINRLIERGYLCRVVPKHTQTFIDTDDVKLNNMGEFSQGQLQAASDREEITRGACEEIIEQGRDRAAWLLFASGVEHAEHVAEHLVKRHGIRATFVHSKMPETVRDERIADYKRGKYRAMVNNGVLTTGFNHPPIDLIAMLRATMSPGLYVQMVGRGMRTHPGKDNCLVLDFARNTMTHGPVNDPILPRPKGEGGGGEPPVRICDRCGTYNHASALVCAECGFEFPITVKFKKTAGTDELLREAAPQIEEMPVSRVVYLPHTSKTGNGSIKVCYYVPAGTFYEYISVEAEGFRGKLGRDWFRQRSPFGGAAVPKLNSDLISMAPSLKVPRIIRVNVAKKPAEVVGYAF